MITIALDEGEHFENPEGCMFVGGVAFQHNSIQDMQKERRRLRELFTSTCKKLNCAYPEDLHYNWSNGRVVNADKARMVKKELEARMPDFMQGKGEWGKKPPFGEYRIFVLLGDQKGIASFCRPGISNLIDDNIACNRYEHMAYRTVENLLFYNPHQRDDSVKLELATRIVKPEADTKLHEDIKKLGLSKSSPSSNDNRYQVTDSGSFRAALASAIQNSDRKDIQFDINVQSINYSANALNNDKVDEKQSFLYLADTVCSIISNNVHSIRKSYEALQTLEAACKKITGKRNFLWVYDEIDQVYRVAFAEIRHGNYFEALAGIYNGITAMPSFAKIYNEIWFCPMIQETLKKKDLFSWRKAVEKLELYLYSVNYDMAMAEYVYDVLKKLAESDIGTYESGLYHLHKVEMMIANHKGDYSGAEEAFEKCISVSDYMPIEEYLELRNMHSTLLLDKGDFRRATVFTTDTKVYEEMLDEIRKMVYTDRKDINIHYGRTLSQLGQCHSYERNFEEAEDCFSKALVLYGDDKVDYQITLSYYLHMLIEKGDVSTYEENAEIYFGARDKKRQFENIIQLDSTTIRYALFVYIKALYIFYRESVPKSFLREVVKRVMKQYKKTSGGHPWELILKYCAFFSIMHPTPDYSSEEIMQKSEEAVAPATGRIQNIVFANRKEYSQVLNGNDAFADDVNVYMYR